MSNKAKKNIAYLLIIYIFCVFTAPSLFSTFSTKNEVKNELIFRGENQTGNTTCEVRELEEIIDLEEDENFSLIGYLDKNSDYSLCYNSDNLFYHGEVLSSDITSVPIYIRHRKLRN